MPDKNESSAEQQQPNADTGPGAAFDVPPESGADKISGNGAAAPEHEHHAAKHRTWNTVLQTGLFIIGGMYSWFAYQQWQAMSGQLKEMTRATDSSTKSAQIEERAWITASLAKLKKPLIAGEIPVVDVMITNSGKTPAMKAENYGDVFVLTEIPPAEMVMQTANDALSRFVLGSNGAVGHAYCKGRRAISQTEIDELRKGESLRIYARGQTTYEDIFGIKHTSIYCFSINGAETDTAEMQSCDIGNTVD